MTRLLCIFVLCMLLTACGLMNPQQQADALASIDAMLANKVITLAQYQALREAILSAGTANWWEQAATALSGAAMAYLGVRINRGPPEKSRAKRAAAGT